MVALSTTEAEYISVTEFFKETMWLHGILSKLGIHQYKVTIHDDSQSVIHLTKHQMFYERSKHIDIKLHFVKDVIESGLIKVKKTPKKENLTYMLTKPLPAMKFKHCMNLVNSTNM